MSEAKTNVIFRKFNNNEVIALFPDLLSGQHNEYIMSYMHIGQHGDASKELMTELKHAKPSEFESLYLELKQIGYDLKLNMNDIKTV